MAYVELNHLRKRYSNGYQAIKDASVAVERGEFVILLGSSGCGKSTLLRMVAGLEDISGGDLLIDGERMNDALPKDRDIAMVFQSYALYPHMTVYENMALALKIRKIDKKRIDTMVREAAEMLNLTDFLKSKPGQLSGGQRQRVALGRAIVRRPKLFLFDEPLSNLDAKLRTRMRQEISALHKAINATILYVTHDQIEAMTMGDKVVVLDGGVVQQIGSPKRLYEHPGNKFVAGFIGSPTMNFIDVAVSEAGTQLQLSAGDDFHLTLPKDDFAALAAYHGRQVTLGVRPEDLHISATPTDNGFFGECGYSEYLGAECHLSVSLQHSEDLLVRISNTEQVSGRVNVLADTQRLHFFDIDSEERISL